MSPSNWNMEFEDKFSTIKIFKNTRTHSLKHTLTRTYLYLISNILVLSNVSSLSKRPFRSLRSLINFCSRIKTSFVKPKFSNILKSNGLFSLIPLLSQIFNKNKSWNDKTVRKRNFNTLENILIFVWIKIAESLIFLSSQNKWIVKIITKHILIGAECIWSDRFGE